MLDTLNPHPALLAAILVEQDVYPADDILIAPADGTPGAGLKEVIACEYDRRQKQLCVTTRSKSRYRSEIEHTLPEKSPLRTFLPSLEQAIGGWQIDLTRREMEHMLGLSPMQPDFFALGDMADEAHRKILAFFLPWQSLIRGDIPLTEKCLQSALQHPVRLSETRPTMRWAAGAEIGRNCVGLDFIVGGKVETTTPRVLAEVGPVPPEILETFVPGGRWRRFLEEALLPCLLPEGWEWELRIGVAAEHSGFRVGGITSEGRETVSRIDIQSFIR